MPRRRLHASSGHHLDTDLIQADLDAGYALLRLAEALFASGERDDARRAVAEAERACADGQIRLERLEQSEAPPYRPRMRELGAAVAAFQSKLK